mmetsp:Transcript_51451/g.115905  ORF Transcript_51451/g.115905 Transcript_51451/m.115905 type:complete len:99 (+) Transcript_51451:119-415(+)
MGSAGEAVPPDASPRVFKLNWKTYPEDRYTEWNLLKLCPDGSCSFLYVTEGPGRCSNDPEMVEELKKSGTWCENEAKTGALVTWSDGKGEVYLWDKLQ